jgi:hypothetical protein
MALDKAVRNEAQAGLQGGRSSLNLIGFKEPE